MTVQLWSGGKDSSCSIVLEHLHRAELGHPPSVIVMSEVMFDKAAWISAELPDHMEWVHEKAKPLFESWGFKVIIEQSEKDYLDCFYHVCKKPKIHQERAGKYSGFPLGGTCLIQRECKIRTAKTVKKKYLSDDKTVEYIGIASDEVKRQGQLGEKRQSLLCRYGVREADTYDILKPFGLLSPIYSRAKRGGCWFCPNQSLEQFSWVVRNHPHLWERLRELSYVENTISRGFKWGEPFDVVDYKLKVYMSQPQQVTFFD